MERPQLFKVKLETNILGFGCLQDLELQRMTSSPGQDAEYNIGVMKMSDG